MPKNENNRRFFPIKLIKIRYKGGFLLMPCGVVSENAYMGYMKCVGALEKPKNGQNRKVALILNLIFWQKSQYRYL